MGACQWRYTTRSVSRLLGCVKLLKSAHRNTLRFGAFFTSGGFMYTLHGDTIQAHGLTFKLSIEQRAWCDSEWVWAGVCLTLMVEDDDGDLVEYDGPLNFNDSLWGLEFWQHESIDHKKNAYITEIIDEITSAIAHQYRAEAAERTACEERDIVTEAA
jgi:hypothetical protein